MADLRRASADLERGARRAADHPWLEQLARFGYAASGLIHLVIGWIALQIALGGGGGGGGSADQSGALEQLGSAPFGAVLLWICVAGFFALALWQALEAVFSSGETSDRAKAVAKAVVYAALGATTTVVALGGSTSSTQSSAHTTGTIMDLPGGRILVALVGLAVVAVGAYHVYKGVTKKFLDDLTTTGGGQVGRGVEWAGLVGYAAKGVALAVVGLLFLAAAWTADAGQSTGLDGALRTLAGQPFGTVLLGLVALGLVLFGGYSFARARYARM